jgi:hypothetical protein
VLGISGSPHDGATAYVVQEVLDFAASLGDVETEYISLRGKKIEFCIHCNYCVRTKVGCVLKDDVAVMYPSMEAADDWLLGTPICQGTLSGQMNPAQSTVARSTHRPQLCSRTMKSPAVRASPAFPVRTVQQRAGPDG